MRCKRQAGLKRGDCVRYGYYSDGDKDFLSMKMGDSKCMTAARFFENEDIKE